MMRTDDLIARLSQDATLPRFRPSGLVVRMALSILVPIALFLLVLGTRHGLLQSWSNPVVPLKTVLPLISCGVSFVLVLRLLRPEARVGITVWAYAVPLLAAVALWGGAFVLRAPAARFAEVGAFSLEECLGSILLLSIVPVIVMLRLMRQGAATSPTLSGALVGLTAASGVATGYSLFCSRDNPLFFVTWYGLAILIVTLISAALGRRMLRW